VGACARNPKYSYRRESGFQQKEEEAHGGARRDQSGQSVQLVAKVGSDRGSTLLEEQQLFLKCHCQLFVFQKNLQTSTTSTRQQHNQMINFCAKFSQILPIALRWVPLESSSCINI
jgi:hypothetical protein